MSQITYYISVMDENYTAMEKELKEPPKPELINPSPFQKPLLPHERIRYQK